MRNRTEAYSIMDTKEYLSYRVKGSFFLILLAVISIISAKAQTLKIGDQAPPLEPYEWIKGDPMDSFKKGTPYVVEFGATWCKPCKGVIPELTELAKSYKGQAEVIGVFVQEINYDRTSKEPKYIENVREYVKKLGDEMGYHVAVDGPEKIIEKNWIDRFGRSRGIPQTFVVDKEGKIAGHFRGASISVVENFLKTIIDGTYDMEEEVRKEKITSAERTTYDWFKPLYIAGNGGDEKSFLFRSQLVKAKGDIKGSPSSFIDSYNWAQSKRWIELYRKKSVPLSELKKYQNIRGRVQEVNIPLIGLYQLAYSDTLWNEPQHRWVGANNKYPDITHFPKFKRSYGKHWPEPLLEVSDASPFQYKSGSPENKWNYVLNVPKDRTTAAFLQRVMQRDLATYFGYEVTLETREMPCWFLMATPGASEKLKTKTPGELYRKGKSQDVNGKVFTHSNGDVRDLVHWLDDLYKKTTGRTNGIAPIIDRTGIKGEIDFNIPEAAYKLLGSNGDFEGFRDFLPNLGLYLEKGTKPMKVVVIRDPNR